MPMGLCQLAQNRAQSLRKQDLWSSTASAQQCSGKQGGLIIRLFRKSYIDRRASGTKGQELQLATQIAPPKLEPKKGNSPTSPPESHSSLNHLGARREALLLKRL